MMMTKPYDYDDDTDDDNDHKNDSYTAAGAAPGASVLVPSFWFLRSGSIPRVALHEEMHLRNRFRAEQAPQRHRCTGAPMRGTE